MDMAGVNALGAGGGHVINPSTGSLGRGYSCMRLLCWLSGQLESEGPRGCCGRVDGDWWFSAVELTFFVPENTISIKFDEVGASFLNALEKNILHIDARMSDCFKRHRMGPVRNVNIMSSASQVIVEVHNDSRFSATHDAIMRLLQQVHPQAQLTQVADVSYGQRKKKVLDRFPLMDARTAPPSVPPMDQV